MWEGQDLSTAKLSPVADFVPLLHHRIVCHAKFMNMNDEFGETTTSNDTIVDLLIHYGWNGYLLNEYESQRKALLGYSSAQLRRQHIMLKFLLGEN
jgi:hypothetical protein